MGAGIKWEQVPGLLRNWFRGQRMMLGSLAGADPSCLGGSLLCEQTCRTAQQTDSGRELGSALPGHLVC